MLPSGYTVAVRSGTAAGGDELAVLAPDGRLCVTIELTERGPSVRIEAAELSVASRGKMQLSADSLTLTSDNDLALVAGGDLRLEAKGKLATQAFEQSIVATHGDVAVQANDDVRLDGERVRLNSPDAAPLRHARELRGEEGER